MDDTDRSSAYCMRMATKDDLLSTLAPVLEALATVSLDDPAQTKRMLDEKFPADGPVVSKVRSLFREGSLREKAEFFDLAKEFFETAVQQVPDSAEAMACVGYAQHRLGDDDSAIGSLRRSLQLDSDHAEARIYLANILYDQGEYEAALYHFERTNPEDHWDELGIWRLIELKRSLYRLDDWVMLLELLVLVLTVASLGAVATAWLNAWGLLLVIGVVIVGILLPILLHHRHLLGRLSVPAASVMVLIGGFILRAVVVLSSEAIPHIGS